MDWNHTNAYTIPTHVRSEQVKCRRDITLSAPVRITFTIGMNKQNTPRPPGTSGRIQNTMSS